MNKLLLSWFIVAPIFLFGQTTVSLVPFYGGKPLALDQKYQLQDSAIISVSTFKCYLSHVNGISDRGKKIAMADIVLIDAEDPAGYVIGKTDEHLQAIEFLVGTDSVTNVSGILDGPLDPIRGMYWTWNSGYINVKLEGKKYLENGEESVFEYHIGGYLAPFATARNIKLQVKEDKNVLQIGLHLDEWLKQMDMNAVPLVMIPGEKAVRLADQLQPVFKLTNNEP